MQRPSQGNGQIKQGDAHQTSGHATPGGGSRDDHDGTTQSDATDYSDYTDDTPAGPCTKEGNPGEAPALLEPGESITVCKDGPILQGECHLQETAVISVINVINRNQCNQRNQLPVSVPPVDVQEVLPCEADQSGAQGQNKEIPLPKGIAARIIHERRWCVLIQLVRRGATAWIVGIATV